MGLAENTNGFKVGIITAQTMPGNETHKYSDGNLKVMEMSETVSSEVYEVEKLLRTRDKRLLASEIVVRLAQVLDVSVEELFEYLEWKENLERIKKEVKNADVKDLKWEASEPVEDFPDGDSAEFQSLLDEIREDVKRWKAVEKKLKAMGLEL